ncbi:hypothetical protein [Thermococcus nautili]|uniref:Uncharacterized protein n=1 Tax=Thermococcus nautili TaxID=195522 RepID=W8P3B9_9EURY|nr:hypothetical protein [Thermococcus nautili]AHL23256.1 hypothetical protein BD01_1652 [Thermococcus nautili]CAI1493107.1 conserved protein of unknown function [Thermococcus nautili]
MGLSRRELIRKLWHVSPGILGAPIILFTPRWALYHPTSLKTPKPF